MRVILDQLEKDLIDYLRGAQELPVEEFGARGAAELESHRVNHAVGTILVAYNGDKFTQPRPIHESGIIVQDATLSWVLFHAFQSMVSQHDLLIRLDAVREKLTGWTPPSHPGFSRLWYSEGYPVLQKSGIYWYAQTYSTIGEVEKR